MSFWKKLFPGEKDRSVDYYEEGVALLGAGQYHEALTSLRLALRNAPEDVAVLTQIAVAYSRIGMTEEAIKTYRTVLRRDSADPGANYGIAFLLLHDGRPDEAAEHLEAFLREPPSGPDAARHIQHARSTLAELRGETVGGEG